ncbi:uncharacterized protein LOC129752214 [Uranotaenia lowii]|uniref:uncharacterized protein LOC129752214 n=1 Tax=Uranotaenia lowii TaxID=190385 RepID=UPI0024784D96|nr:uncharacterized protein LOC129752214 [Uranotaenia lowii]
MVLITNLIPPQIGTIAVGPCDIVSKRAIKYLGVIIDDRLSFTSPVDFVSKRATMATAALIRMMSNSSATRSSKRRKLSSVTTSILRYEAADWWQALGRQCNLQRLSSIQRLMNLRVINGYRTISSENACVLSGVMPISVLLGEEVFCNDNKDTPDVQDLANENSMSNWQQLWNSSARGYGPIV